MDSSLIRARPTRPLPKPSLLKDHLLDDMGSCSSNGFKTFPRRSQCCTTVRFLHDLDRKTQKQKKHLKLGRTPPKSALSAFRKIFSAAKRLPFAARPQRKARLGSPSLARSLSRKISGFWKRKKKSDEEEVIGRWGLPDRRTEDESVPLIKSGDSRSDSWSSGSGFTVSDDFLSSGKCSSPEVNLNLPENGNDFVGPVKEGGACTKSAADSTKIEQWTSDCQEKEQFSPVSVLDCSYEEEDEVSSRFQHSLARVEGTKAKLMKTIQRYEGLAKLEPINLATKFASHLNSDHEHSSGSFDSPPINEKSTLGAKDEEDEDEHEALGLMYQMKNTYLASLDLEAETLVLDFFREKIADKRANSEKGRCGPALFEMELVEEVRDWLNGKKDARECFVGWEDEKSRLVHVYDMEKRGEWIGLDEERDEVSLELENVFFVELMDELLLEISS
ncbi:Unknown protein [Striga hermonthica]|uniref:DUF4378 domain-containing protein n=1 Tax=Striga hermonthica TaxID=68872 RepID=A0A9N7RRZ6_STRHE|nr:Unknown protein [Striga hermonthica]